jgi:uncharacterized protein (TIGR03000 family)
MFRKAFAFGGLLLLAGATALVTPSLTQARGGGRGGGGGGHGSGGSHGGGHFGRGVHGGHVGDFRGGFHHEGFGHRFGGYGYYPYYGGYTYDPYAHGQGDVMDDWAYYGSSEDATPYDSGGYSSLTPSPPGYQSAPPAADNAAQVTLTVPPGARVSFGGAPTTSTGPVREYVSPALTPGKQYAYEVQARWNDNGQEVTQTQQVEVSAGAHVNVAFPRPSAPKR